MASCVYLGYMVALKSFPSSSACVRPAWVRTPPHLSTSSSSDRTRGAAAAEEEEEEGSGSESGGAAPAGRDGDGGDASGMRAASGDGTTHFSGLSCT